MSFSGDGFFVKALESVLQARPILLGIGIGALFGCYQLLKSGLGLFKLSPLRLRGSLLARSDNSKIYHQVEQLASRLGAQAPDNIVVGLEPNFFVTSSAVELIGEKSGILEGKTLFISLSLMRILGIDELIAVIGHELGHFRGLDTEYSLKFAPVYSRLSSALKAMSSNDEGASALATLPAAVVLGVCLTEFATAERTVGRERELLADRAGAEAASATALASALVKVSLYSGQWSALTQKHIDILAEGNYFENLAGTYRAACESLFDGVDWQEAQASMLRFVQPHPIDTHPPLAQRLQSLGVALVTIEPGTGKPSPEPSISLLSGTEEIEKYLTNLEIQWLVAIGAVVIPKLAK